LGCVGRRGTWLVALLYRICMALAVNEQAHAGGHGMPASRYNRWSLPICWPGHLKSHHEIGLAGNYCGRIGSGKLVSGFGGGVASRWEKRGSKCTPLAGREKIISRSEMTTHSTKMRTSADEAAVFPSLIACSVVGPRPCVVARISNSPDSPFTRPSSRLFCRIAKEVAPG
jgi:hypothetical protein